MYSISPSSQRIHQHLDDRWHPSSQNSDTFATHLPIIQIESARALGLSERQIFLYIIFPQAIKNILAPISGQLANLIKDSSLLSVIALNELTQSIQEVNSYIFATLEGYIVLAFAYLILTLPIGVFSRYLERKYQK